MPKLGKLGYLRVGKTSEGRPVILNPDGSMSTERTATEYLPELGGWYNIPTMYGGEAVSMREAMARVLKSGGRDTETGRDLTRYDTMKDALRDAPKRSRGIKTILDVPPHLLAEMLKNF